jgi:hypothetical protein
MPMWDAGKAVYQIWSCGGGDSLGIVDRGEHYGIHWFSQTRVIR